MPSEGPTPHGAASGHGAPTAPLPIVREDAQDHRRSLQVMRWGLVPCWVKASTAGCATINAKTEGVWGFLPLPLRSCWACAWLCPRPENVPALSSLLGVHGCLERARCACDPATEPFSCGPASPVGSAAEAHQWMHGACGPTRPAGRACAHLAVVQYP